MADYSGTPLMRTPLGPKILSFIEILALFRTKSPSERMLTLFCNENFKLEAGFTAGCG